MAAQERVASQERVAARERAEAAAVQAMLG
jgi:hypothetical protein